MTFLALSSKRFLRNAAFLISLAIMLLSVIGAALCNDGFLQVRAGIYCPDSEIANSVAEKLEEYDFARYASESELALALEKREISAGIVLPDDFDSRIKNVNLENCARFLHAPEALLPEIFKLAGTAEIFAAAAPYIASASFTQGDITDKTLENYNGYLSGEPFFTLETVSVYSGEPIKSTFALSLAMAVIAVTVFAGALLLACRFYEKSYADLCERVGGKKAFSSVFLPEMLVWTGFTALAELFSALAFWGITGSGELLAKMPSLLAFTVAALAISLWLSLVLKAQALQLLIVPALLLTVIACPVFVDFELFIPAVKYLRFITPTYLAFVGRWYIVLATSAAALIGALLIYKNKR